MRIETKIIFEEDDMKMLRAVKKLIGATSPAFRNQKGLSTEESDLCSIFYNSIPDDEGEE